MSAGESPATEFVNPVAYSELDKEAKNIQTNGESSVEIVEMSSGNENKTKFRKMYLAALASLLNAICMGFGSTYTATALDNMKNNVTSSIHPDADEEGWIGSLLAVGALIGSGAAGNLAQTLGRRGAQLLSTLPFIIGWLFITFATSVPFLYVGRIFVGFACGLVSVTSPMYLVEIATPEVRGLLGASFQLFVMVGVLMVNVFGSFMNWNWLAAMGCILSVATLVIMYFVPESPRWLMAKGKADEAKNSIQWLQGNFVNASELIKSIQEDIDNQPKGSFSFGEFAAPEAYKPALLSFALMFFQQISGVNAILFYTVEIFKKAGSTLSGTAATIIVVAVGLGSTLLSSILSDKAGRKILLLLSGAFMTLSLGVFGVFDYVASKNGEEFRTSYGWLPVVCLIIYMAAFSVGYGPIPWLMVGEMTTARLRSVTSGIATALNWTCVFAVTKSFHSMTDAIHSYGVYWFYAGICLLSCIFAIFLLPETKGKTFEEIQQNFTRRKVAKKDSIIENEEIPHVNGNKF